MTDLLFSILPMSLLAGVVTLAILPLRWVLRRLRLSAGLCLVLWMAVLVRMVLPVGAVTSAFSFLRWTAPAVERQVETFSQLTQPAAPPVPAVQGQDFSPVVTAEMETASPTPHWSGAALAWVWGLGVLGLWLYTAVSALRLHLRLQTAVRRGNGAEARYESDRITAPFVFGLLHPKIYVPCGLDGEAQRWVLRHERTHLRLGHHWLKPLFFLILGVHWFNPLLWLAWVLFCRDLEVFCDEQVLKAAPEGTAAYSSALLSLAAPRQGLLLPPGFGENGVKDRIKRVLRYQKPARWAAVLAALVTVLAVCGLAADPASQPDAAQPDPMSRALALSQGEISGNPMILLDDQPIEFNGDQVYRAPYQSYLYLVQPQDRRGTYTCSVSTDPSQPGTVCSGGNSRLPVIGFTIQPRGLAHARIHPITGTGWVASWPDQTQYYTLSYTWEDGTRSDYCFTLQAYQPWPELDRDTLSIRFPGETEWTDLTALIPAPAAWAEQDMAGRSQIKTLSEVDGLADLYFQWGFVSGMDGWLTFSYNAGGVGPYCSISAYRTHDGGHTWTEAGSVDGTDYGQDQLWTFVNCGAFLDNDHAVLGTGPYNSAPVLYTEDGGRTWNPAALPQDQLAPWHTVSFAFTGPDGIMIQRRHVDNQEESQALFTHDYGKNWTLLDIPEAHYDTNGWLTVDPEAWRSGALWVWGDLPEEDITLYGLNETATGMNGVLLRRGTHLDCFPLSDSPTAPMPSHLAWADYDGDGENELAVSLCTGTGTGSAAYHLYLFPWRHGRFCTPVELSESDLAAQVSAAVQSTYDPKNFAFSVQTAGQSWTLDLSADAGWLADVPVGPLTASWRFSYDLAPLEVSIALMPEGLPLYTPVTYRVPLRFDGTRIALDTRHGALSANPGALLIPQ